MEWKRAYPKARREHASRNNKIREHKGTHSKGKKDRLSRVRMQRRIDNLLRMPQLGRHELHVAILIRCE